jgi:hypothetical protein
MFGRKKKGPNTKAGKLIADAGKRKCAKPIPGGRCNKDQGHWGDCR